MPIVKMGEGGLTAVGTGFPTALQGSPWVVNGSSGSAFTPASIAGLRLWLDAFFGVNKDGSNRVNSMTDQASGFVFTSSGGDRPLWFNDTFGPVIRFDGATSLTNTTDVILSRVAPFTTYHVFKGTAGLFPVVSNLKTNSGDGQLTFLSSDPGFEKIQFGINGFLYARSDTLPPTLYGTYHQAANTYNGSGGGSLANFGIVVDGTTATVTSGGNPGFGNPDSVIGGWSVSGGGFNFQGDLVAILAYDSVLTAPQLALLQAYYTTRLTP